MIPPRVWPGFAHPRLPAFKGGQTIRANVACAAWERPRAPLRSPRFDRLRAGSPASLERGQGWEPTSASQRHNARRRPYVLSALIPFRLDGAALVQIPQRFSSTAPQSPVWGLSGCGGDARACEVVNSSWYQGWAGPHPPIPPLHRSGADRTYGRRRAFWRWDALVRPHPLPLSSFAGEGRPEPCARAFECGASHVGSDVLSAPELSTYGGEGGGSCLILPAPTLPGRGAGPPPLSVQPMHCPQRCQWLPRIMMVFLGGGGRANAVLRRDPAPAARPVALRRQPVGQVLHTLQKARDKCRRVEAFHQTRVRRAPAPAARVAHRLAQG